MGDIVFVDTLVNGELQLIRTVKFFVDNLPRSGIMVIYHVDDTLLLVKVYNFFCKKMASQKQMGLLDSK